MFIYYKLGKYDSGKAKGLEGPIEMNSALGHKFLYHIKDVPLRMEIQIFS